MNLALLGSPAPFLSFSAHNTNGLALQLAQAETVGSSISGAESDEESNITPSLLSNLTCASYCGQANLSTLEFHLFKKLPIEVRLRIWRLAINVPQIVEIEKRSDDKRSWHFRAKSVPALFLVNYECTQEARKCYYRALCDFSRNSSFPSTSPQGSSEARAFKVGPLFLRPTLDIVYLKDFEFSSSDTGLLILPTRLNPLASVQTLALNREALLSSSRPPEFVLQQHLPNLKLLVLLIDDASQIDGNPAWHSYAHYEGRDKYWSAAGIGGESMRKEFCELSTGPFELEVRNKIYARYIEDDFRGAVEVERDLNRNYVAPTVVVAGCGLPKHIDPAVAAALPEREHPDDCWCLEDDRTEEPEEVDQTEEGGSEVDE